MPPTRKEHIFENGIEKKFCTSCMAYKSTTEFHKNKRTWDELGRKCKLCRRFMRRQYEININFKECPGCKLTKAEIYFDQSRFTPDKLKRLCKTCNDPDPSSKTKICSLCFLELPLSNYPGPRTGASLGACNKCLAERKRKNCHSKLNLDQTSIIIPSIIDAPTSDYIDETPTFSDKEGEDIDDAPGTPNIVDEVEEDMCDFLRQARAVLLTDELLF